MKTNTLKRFTSGGNMQAIRYGWLAMASAALVMSACAQDNGDINRVQPNVVKKTELLDGQWYLRNTITYTPATTGFTFAGETGTMEKIVWEIQEDTLVGYRSYPFVPGQDKNVEPNSRPSGVTAKVCDANGICAGGQKYYGTAVVAYPIKSRFDIQRDYDTTTGEQSNVIGENSNDRPWNEREFIRVDWANNLINKRDNMGYGSLLNANDPRRTDTGSWINPNEPGSDPYDWPTAEYGNDGRLVYLDFTGRYLAKPESIYYEGYGEIPLCWFYDYYQYDCSASEIRMRTSISKVDPKVTNDYEPLVYGNDLMEKFGYFRTERLNYDRKFGFTESGRIYLANRHRIWESSFEKDANGYPDQTKPIAFASRTPKPIAYYLSPASRMRSQAEYDEYRQASRALETNWDKAFRRAVAAAQGQGDNWQAVRQMVFICDNPVPEGAPAECGQAGFAPRFGDLRYNFLWTTSEPTPNGLLGYGPSSPDPETGEIISANANMYSAGVDSSAQYVLDAVNLMSGDITPDKFITGEDVRKYISQNPAYALPHGVNRSSLQSALQGIAQSNELSTGAFQRPTERSTKLMQSLATSGGLPRLGANRFAVAADILKTRPELEALILDNPDFQNGVHDMVPPALAAKALADPRYERELRRTALSRVTDSLDFEKQRIEYASRKNLYLVEFLDPTMQGLTKKEAEVRKARVAELISNGSAGCVNENGCTPLEARGIADEELRVRARARIWQAVAEHEIGHTFGLRHNFQGSFDSVNYFEKFWDLRQPTLTVQQGGQAKVPRTPDDLKLSSDAALQLTTVNGKYEISADYEYSSIMDYHGRVHSDWQGVGKYDEAAILFAYSGGSEPGYVEIFKAARKGKAQFPGSDGKLVEVTGAGDDLPVVNAEHVHQAVPNYPERYHYSLIPLHFGQGGDVTAAMKDGIAKLKHSNRTIMKWSEVKAKTAQLTTKLQSNPNLTDAEKAAFAAQAPLEVPYMFCTDDHVGAVPSCRRFDLGADYYEMSRHYLERQWNTYFFNHFRRDRYAFNAWNVYSATRGNFIGLSDTYKHWVRAFYENHARGSQNLGVYNYDPSVQDTWTMGVMDGATAQLAIMSVSPVGFYALWQNGSATPGKTYPPRWNIVSRGYEFDDLTEDGKNELRDYYGRNYGATAFADLRRGVGRNMFSRYDYKSGFGFFRRVLEVGHYYDQYGALQAAVDPSVEFLGADVTADRNRYAVPYYLVFKDEFGSSFANTWSEGDSMLPTLYFQTDAGGNVTSSATLVAPSLIRGSNFVQNFDYPRTVERNALKPEQKGFEAELDTTWTAKFLSLYWGMALFSVNYDLDYAKQNFVYRVGAAEQVQLAPGYEAVEVADIVQGARYVAIQPVGSTVDSPAVQKIKKAQAYQQIASNPAMCPVPEYLERNAYAGCMNPQDAANPAKVAERKAWYEKSLQNALRDLDIMRGFYDIFGRAF